MRKCGRRDAHGSLGLVQNLNPKGFLSEYCYRVEEKKNSFLKIIRLFFSFNPHLKQTNVHEVLCIQVKVYLTLNQTEI